MSKQWTGTKYERSVAVYRLPQDYSIPGVRIKWWLSIRCVMWYFHWATWLMFQIDQLGTMKWNQMHKNPFLSLILLDLYGHLLSNWQLSQNIGAKNTQCGLSSFIGLSDFFQNMQHPVNCWVLFRLRFAGRRCTETTGHSLKFMQEDRIFSLKEPSKLFCVHIATHASWIQKRRRQEPQF